MLNKFYDLRKKRTPQLAGDNGDLPEPAVADEVELFAEDEYRRQLAARALELMQAEFSPSTWKACWEHVVEGRSAPEIAAELGMTPGAVYAARFRVIGRLRKELEGLMD
jgi:RNA polymerase sigma-70 factor (ECF subfamily)